MCVKITWRACLTPVLGSCEWKFWFHVREWSLRVCVYISSFLQSLSHWDRSSYKLSGDLSVVYHCLEFIGSLGLKMVLFCQFFEKNVLLGWSILLDGGLSFHMSVPLGYMWVVLIELEWSSFIEGGFSPHSHQYSQGELKSKVFVFRKFKEDFWVPIYF
jgi:hypothetical protein